MKENQTQEEIDVQQEEYEKLVASLPRASIKAKPSVEMIKYENYWFFSDNPSLRNVVTFQKHFVARDSDIFITSLPKTGSTWLKSLLFATVNRANYPNVNESPLSSNHPQELVCNLENDVYSEAFAYPRPHDLNELPQPRLLSTHVSYTSLPESIRTCGCRILYICRNPFDTVVSLSYFIASKMKAMGENMKQPCLEDLFEDFCDGRFVFGPFFEHVLGYWKMSLEQPNKILFIKYEDLKEDTTFHLKRLAEFIGMPFSPQEENEGVVQQIVEFCSIKNLKELEVNKSGVINKFYEKKSYFRKGEVGDWTNLFTPNMVESMNKLMEHKLGGTGLTFKVLPN